MDHSNQRTTTTVSYTLPYSYIYKIISKTMPKRHSIKNHEIQRQHAEKRLPSPLKVSRVEEWRARRHPWSCFSIEGRRRAFVIIIYKSPLERTTCMYTEVPSTLPLSFFFLQRDIRNRFLYTDVEKCQKEDHDSTKKRTNTNRNC